MMSSYPLSRCPVCKKAFRLEIKGPTIPSPTMGADCIFSSGSALTAGGADDLESDPRPNDMEETPGAAVEQIGCHEGIGLK